MHRRRGIPNESGKKCIFAVTVHNQPGVLARIVGLFSARGYNIESLAVGETENKEYSRMTIVTNGEANVLEQIRKQLGKVVDTIRVQDCSSLKVIERDLALIKIAVSPKQRQEIKSLVDIFRAKIVEVGMTSMIIEITGDEDKLNAFISILKEQMFKILEMARSGRITMAREPFNNQDE